MSNNCKTTPEYWDCECRNNYIHPATQNECPKCGALRDEQPDSIVAEVIKVGLPINARDIVIDGFEFSEEQ